MECSRGGDSIQGKGPRVVVGCAGWSSFRPRLVYGENWKSRFSSVLQAYAHIFKFVEINSTFYRLPKVSTVQRWREEVGDNFIFSMKAPRTITHEKKFASIDDDVEAMLEVASALKPFLILFQTPKSLRYTEERLRQIVDLVKSLPDKYLYGFELRGWTDEEIKRLLDKVPVIHVVDPFVRNPLTGTPFYLRLHGNPPGEQMYKYKYTESDLSWLKDYVERLEGDIYIVFNNIWMCEDAMRFMKML